MTKPEKKEEQKILSKDKDKTEKKDQQKKVTEPIKEESLEEKLKNTHEKLLRTMAEMENQRRRFEKEKQEAFEFGGFNFAAESLLLIDNIDRAIVSFKNDESLKLPEINYLEQWLKWKTKEEDLKRKKKRHLNLVVLTLLQNPCCF